METNHWAFNNAPRASKDGKWFIGYVATLVVTAIIGTVAWSNTWLSFVECFAVALLSLQRLCGGNPLFHRAISDTRFMHNPHSCSPGHSGRRLLDEVDDELIEAFWRVAARAILGSLVPALIAGFAIIQLFRKAPQTMVVIGLSLPMVFFAVMAITMVAGGIAPLALVYIVPAVVLAVIIFRYRSRLQLVGRMMKVAADSLAANPALVPFALGANCAVIPPLVGLGAALYFLQGNGDVAKNPALSTSSSYGCRDEHGTLAACCVWKPAPWVLPVQIAVGIVLMWTDALAAQLRTFVMGGVVTQWYFHGETQGTIKRSLKHALGPARGTLCFSAAVITVCNMIRALADRIRNHRGHPVYFILGLLFSWLLDMIQEAIRFVSNLATIQAAATGEAFIDAARSVGALLMRHSLSAVTVWWLPSFVLGTTLFGIAMIAATAAFYISTAMWKDSHRHNATTDAIALSAIVAYVFLVLCGWLLGFIKSATDVVYLCFARDLDNRAVTRPEVHEVLKDVPNATGAVVVQPDNDMMYGAMEQGDSPTAPLTGPPAQPERDLTAAIEAHPPLAPRKDDM